METNKWIIRDRAISTLLSLCTAAFAVGCAPFYMNDAPPPTFSGLQELRKDGTIRVLFIHGMGDHFRYDPDEILTGLTKKLNLVQIVPPLQEDPDAADRSPKFLRPLPTLIRPLGSPAPAKLYLYNFEKASGGDVHDLVRAEKPFLTFGFLLWDPLTREIKDERLSEKEHPRYAWFNGLVKTLVDRGFADAVLYSGLYRSIMQKAVEQAICLFIAGDEPVGIIEKQWNPADCPVDVNDSAPIGLISQSLGSIMIYDAIWAMVKNQSGTPMEQAGRNIASRTDLIYMLANQLPLIELSRVSSYQVSEGSPRIQQGIVPSLKNFIDLRNDTRRATSYLEVVGISDPNDDLSFHLSPSAIQEPRVRYSNIYVRNTFDWLLFADPYAAHTDYTTNSDVIDIIVCGMMNGQIKC